MGRKKKEVYGVIYKATNIQNHKVYIGLTTRPFEKYKNNHFRDALNHRDDDSRYFYNALRKYGEHNFKWEILGECYSEEELNKSEIECIAFFRSFGKDIKIFDSIYGYNMTIGGRGIKRGSLSEEECREIGERTSKRFEDPLEREKQAIISKEMWQRPGHWEKISSKRIKLLSERPDLREVLIHSGPDHYLYKEINLEEIKEMYENGLSCPKIAKQLGVSTVLIYSRLKLAGVTNMKEIGYERERIQIDNDIVLQYLVEDKSFKEVISLLGVGRNVFKNRCKEWGISFRHDANHTTYKEIDINEIIKLKEKGLSHEEVAEELGVSRVTIRDRLKKHNISYPQKHQGNFFPETKRLDIDEILRLKKEGVIMKEIARIFNCNVSTIERRIKNPEKWRVKDNGDTNK